MALRVQPVRPRARTSSSRAIQEQVERGYGVGPQSPLAGRAAELVCELGGNERAVFCNSGTEAVMGAIRAARTYTGRSKIAYFAGSLPRLVGRRAGAARQRRRRRDGAPRARPAFAALPLDDVLMLDYDEPASLDRLARAPARDRGRGDGGARAEPPARHPAAAPSCSELRRMTREAGTLLLFDELITGFRIGPGRRAGLLRHRRRPGDVRKDRRRRAAHGRGGGARARS